VFGAIKEVAGWSLMLLRPPRLIGPTRQVSPRLRGARPARRHTGTGHQPVLSGGASEGPIRRPEKGGVNGSR
jgi:hypothetical protein